MLAQELDVPVKSVEGKEWSLGRAFNLGGIGKAVSVAIKSPGDFTLAIFSMSLIFAELTGRSSIILAVIWLLVFIVSTIEKNIDIIKKLYLPKEITE